LAETEAAELAAHLATCPACRAAHRGESALDAALGRLPRPRASEALTARLQAMVNDAPPARRKPRAWLAAAGAFAAAAVLLLVLFTHQRGVSAHDALAREAVSDHLRVLYSDRGPEVESGG